MISAHSRPLSSPQLEMRFAHEFLLGKPYYNTRPNGDIRGPLDIERLPGAMQVPPAEADTLRSHLRRQAHGPVQWLDEAAPLHLDDATLAHTLHEGKQRSGLKWSQLMTVAVAACDAGRERMPFDFPVAGRAKSNRNIPAMLANMLPLLLDFRAGTCLNESVAAAGQEAAPLDLSRQEDSPGARRRQPAVDLRSARQPHPVRRRLPVRLAISPPCTRCPPVRSTTSRSVFRGVQTRRLCAAFQRQPRPLGASRCRCAPASGADVRGAVGVGARARDP